MDAMKAQCQENSLDDQDLWEQSEDEALKWERKHPWVRFL